MKMLRILRYCLLSFVVIALAVMLPALATKLLGGDVQQWKWFTVFYGGLALVGATFFAIVTMVWHGGLLLTHRWQKMHG